MPLTSAQLTSLKSELLSDPLTYSYGTHLPTQLGGSSTAADWVAIAALVNKVRNGGDGEAAITLKRDDISSSEIFHAIAIADLVANPGAAQLEWFHALLVQTDNIRLVNDDDSNTPVRTNVLALTTAGSPTRTRLQALETRFGSRAEVLFGRNTSVTPSECERAGWLP